MCSAEPVLAVFAEEFSGKKHLIYSVDLDASQQPLGPVKEQSHEVRAKLHEANDWSLPPKENLGYQLDLVVLEPLVSER